ncbi:MAG: glycosyltransferase [Opitutaceae bacterium]|nr:glycosyltransferase [Opitutaceae bacterium]
MPAVTVLMVTHRATPFLRPAIDSVWAQAWRDLELLLVDNGAGLDPDVLGEAGRDPRLRLLRLPANAGIPAGHNAGVAAAQGEFIALLDHDDRMLPARLERQVEWLRQHRTAGLVGSRAETIDAAGRVTGAEFSLASAEEQHRYLPYACPVVTPAYTGRRAVFAALPYRAEFPLAADFDFLARASARYGLGAVPEVLLQYRRHAGQATVEHAAAIERQRCAIRLRTARRRAGRAEGPADFPGTGDSPAACCLACADQCRREGFAVLAAYHARRALSLERSAPMALRSAVRGLGAVAGASATQRGPAWAMYRRGPVQALGLHPE